VRPFIVFEGGEGSGKSTQARLLKGRLLNLGTDVVHTREPGGTRLGDRLRRWIKWRAEVTPQSELLFILAARSQVVTEVIRPALANGAVAICDRYTYSTLAYQGHGRGMDLGLLRTLNEFVTGGIAPDLVVFLDIDPLEGLKRKRGQRDRFEQEEVEFHRRVREGYLKMAADDPGRWLVVDGSLSRKEIQAVVWQRVERLLR
jgi:dTMP kinase